MSSAPPLPLPLLAEALANQGIIVDSATIDVLRCHIPPQQVINRFSLVHWMQAGEFTVEQRAGKLIVRSIPAFARLCVGSAGVAITVLSLLPGSLVQRILAGLFTGAATLVAEYLYASAALPPSFVNAVDSVLTNQAALSSERLRNAQ